MTKYIIFDTGSLINIVQNGLVDQFKELSQEFQGEFLVTPEVIYEGIEHPMQIKRFEWGALRIKQLLDEEIIKSVEDEGLVDKKELDKRTSIILERANNSLFSEGKAVNLIEKGEAECLALSMILKERKIENLVVIDERTARMLTESPDNLRLLMEQKLKAKFRVNQDNLNYFKDIKVIRSKELMYVAYKKKLFEGDGKTLDAVLYALKFGGCSISDNEIETMKKL